MSPLKVDVLHPEWHFFQVTFPYERPLLIVVDATKRKKHQELERWHAAARACRAPKVLAARLVDEHHPGFHMSFISKFVGDMVLADDLFIAEQP